MTTMGKLLVAVISVGNKKYSLNPNNLTHEDNPCKGGCGEKGTAYQCQYATPELIAMLKLQGFTERE